VFPLEVKHYHPAGSGHKPVVRARMVYDDEALYGIFHVQDRYVVCTHPGFQSHVFKDSCVEFFVRPKQDQGYMNFEMSCGGHLLSYYIRDWRRKTKPVDLDDEFVDRTKVPWEIGQKVRIFHSMPETLPKEIEKPVEWFLEFHIPFEVLEHYVGPVRPVTGQQWRGNFNKCADGSSHPHWGTWSSLGEELNMHQPDKFGILRFE